MGKITIPQSRLRVSGSQIPNVGSAAIPIQSAIYLGRDISRAGAEIEKLKKETRNKEDKNRYQELTDQIGIDIDQRLSKFKNISDLESGLELFNDEVNINNYKTILEGENKNVQNLVSSWMYKQRGSRRTKLVSDITKKHLEKSIFYDNKTLNELSIDAASSDPFKRKNALEEIDLWFKDPTNFNTYGQTGLAEKRQSLDLQIRKNQYLFQTQNNPIDVVKNAAKIRTEFNDDEAELIIENAKKAIASQQFQLDQEDYEFELQDSNQKVQNFAEILLRFNGPAGDRPTLDDIIDLEKSGRLNSAQADQLLKVYAGENFPSSDYILDAVFGQMRIAQTVDDIDTLQRTINLDPAVVKSLNVQDITTFNQIFEKYKNDTTEFQDYKHYESILDADLGKLDVQKVVSRDFGSSKNVTENPSSDKLETKRRLNGKKLYNDLILNNVRPEDAYIQVLRSITNKEVLPTIQELIQPATVTIEAPEQFESNFSSAKYFEDLRKKAVDSYRITGNYNAYREDISRLDTIEDVVNLRFSILKDYSSAFADTNEITKKGKEANTGK